VYFGEPGVERGPESGLILMSGTRSNEFPQRSPRDDSHL